jgi:hypothetical protein
MNTDLGKNLLRQQSFCKTVKKTCPAKIASKQGVIFYFVSRIGMIPNFSSRRRGLYQAYNSYLLLIKAIICRSLLTFKFFAVLEDQFC